MVEEEASAVGLSFLMKKDENILNRRTWGLMTAVTIVLGVVTIVLGACLWDPPDFLEILGMCPTYCMVWIVGIQLNTENGGGWGKKDWANIEEVVEQLSVNQGDHEETHVSNVEVFSYTHVAAGNNNDAINGSGSLVGVHMVAVETEKQEVECMKAGGGNVLFQDVQCVHAVMGKNEVECALSAGNVKKNWG
jgi:hypothetical protein